MSELANKIVTFTDASSGIGKATAHLLAARGARVWWAPTGQVVLNNW